MTFFAVRVENRPLSAIWGGACDENGQHKEDDMSDLTLEDLIPGTMAARLDGKLAIVLEQKPGNPSNPVIFQMAGKALGARYKGPVADFTAVVGLVDMDALREAATTMPGGPPRSGHAGVDDDFLVPDSLKGIKVGDQIRIRGRRGDEVVTYEGYNHRRPRYPVSFTTVSGRQMKGGVSIVLGKAG